MNGKIKSLSTSRRNVHFYVVVKESIKLYRPSQTTLCRDQGATTVKCVVCRYKKKEKINAPNKKQIKKQQFLKQVLIKHKIKSDIQYFIYIYLQKLKHLKEGVTIYISVLVQSLLKICFRFESNSWFQSWLQVRLTVWFTVRFIVQNSQSRVQFWVQSRLVQDLFSPNFILVWVWFSPDKCLIKL